ncbi:DUF2073 domain-containing protein [Candidatus Woesearchaeota archaeon]|nr:DUF2073 domain-containing protein [Candidatus Woesearchaeota archaeon]
MLTFEFVTYNEINDLDPEKRIKKLLSIVKEEKIVLLEGRLRKEEEASLIEKTMESIDTKFKGIELGVIYPDEKVTHILQKLKRLMRKVVLGNREGFTIIGPATIIKEIKRDPNKIQLFTIDKKEKNPKKR